MRITKREIDQLQYAGRRKIFWDDELRGFGVRLQQGRKSYVVNYHVAGRRRLLTIANVGELSVKQARDQARAYIVGAKNGADALAMREAERNADTVAELATLYMEKHAKRRKKSWRQDEGALNRDVLPKLGRMKAKDVRRRDIIELVEGIAERAPMTANRTLEVVRKMFNFAIERDILETTPCAMVRAPAKERSRDRVLTETEIATFWRALNEAPMSEPVRWALRLMLVTAQRRGEIAVAAWSELDLNGGWWVIPGERAKNGLSHRVPLSPLADEIIDKIKVYSDGSRYLFPNPSRTSHVNPQALTRAIDRNRPLFAIERFAPHDLRRTAASHMTSMGIPRLTVAKILNHVESGITATYDRHSYDTEKRQALNRWSRKLQEIFEGAPTETVVSIR